MVGIINPGYMYASLLIAALWAALGNQRWRPGDLERKLAIALAIGVFLSGMLVYASIMNVGAMAAPMIMP